MGHRQAKSVTDRHRQTKGSPFASPMHVKSTEINDHKDSSATTSCCGCAWQITGNRQCQKDFNSACSPRASRPANAGKKSTARPSLGLIARSRSLKMVAPPSLAGTSLRYTCHVHTQHVSVPMLTKMCCCIVCLCVCVWFGQFLDFLCAPCIPGVSNADTTTS